MSIALLTADPAALLPELRDLARREPALEAALARAGLRSTWLAWGQSGSLEEAKNVRAILVRTSWDCCDSVQRRDQFLAWLRAATSTPHPPLLLNPLQVLQWGTDKRYLLELGARGALIVPTVAVVRGEALPDLLALAAQWGCQTLVLKPVVGASARAVARHKLGAADSDAEAAAAVAAAEAELRRLVEEEGVALVQPFLTSVLAQGEVSVVCVGGEPLGAMRKRPAANDFRVQEEYGGRYQRLELHAALLEAAACVLALLPDGCVYARLDFLEGSGGQLQLLEAEVVEPELYFDDLPAAAEALAQAVAAALT